MDSIRLSLPYASEIRQFTLYFIPNMQLTIGTDDCCCAIYFCSGFVIIRRAEPMTVCFEWRWIVSTCQCCFYPARLVSQRLYVSRDSEQCADAALSEMVGWPSGRRRATRNRVTLKKGSRVRIPVPPPIVICSWNARSRGRVPHRSRATGAGFKSPYLCFRDWKRSIM